MSLQITRTEDLGDGTVRVFTRTEAGNAADVIVGRDLVANGDVYDVLAAEAARVDDKAASLVASKNASLGVWVE